MGSLLMSSSIARSTSVLTQHSVVFGAPAPDALFVPLRPLAPGDAVEVWEAGEDVVFGAMVAEETQPLERISRELYAGLIEDVRAQGYPYFVRMWNYVGGINEYDGDSERYKLFCAGRHDAFVAAGYHHDVDLPAASAVGMRGRGLITYFLAAREPGSR
jgi:hypothetical protein